MLRQLLPPLLTCALCSLLLAGCSGGGPDDTPNLGYVTGVVTMDDEPLEGVMVAFESENSAVAMGMTDAQGKYELTYVNGEAGAPIGKHVVRISTPQPGEAPDPSFQDPIPKKYNQDSELTAEVVAEDNELDFALSSE